MNRRGFLAGLLGLPAMTKLAQMIDETEVRPAEIVGSHEPEAVTSGLAQWYTANTDFVTGQWYNVAGQWYNVAGQWYNVEGVTTGTTTVAWYVDVRLVYTQ
jgi:hypothetical protein